ncbi:hypothetical protein DIPPA_05328 [Diplonema papillatum]|nr:hypothetical protein DIPPA_05328 [Diplonema papillatum]
MRQTAPTQAVFRRTAPGFLSRTRAAGTSSARKANHYFIAYQKLHDHDLTHLSPPGTPDPRQRYWWRRVWPPQAVSASHERLPQFTKPTLHPNTGHQKKVWQ